MTPEGKVKREINKLLDRHGCYRFMPVNSQFSKKTVDYLVCAYGVFVGIEAKALGGKPTQLQKITLESIGISHGYTFVVDGPESLKDLELFLDAASARFSEAQSPSGAA